MARKTKSDKHPVLDWNMRNTIVETDSAGNIKPCKKKSTEKIDGVVASLMGLARAILQDSEQTDSVYDTRGLLFV